MPRYRDYQRERKIRIRKGTTMKYTEILARADEAVKKIQDILDGFQLDTKHLLSIQETIDPNHSETIVSIECIYLQGKKP